MPEPVWYLLRLSRSNPPGRASTDEKRRRTYTAALNQFEELFEASTRVSAASRPLPIFYALAQAGRAIVAAHGSVPGPKTHGLTLAEPAVNLMDTPVKRAGDGWFQAVSKVLESADIGELPLARVWAAIPDLAFTPLPIQLWPTALIAAAGPLLGKFALYSSRSVRVAVRFNETLVDVPAARTLLANYPAAQDAAVVHIPGAETTALTYETPNGKGILVDFSLPPDQPDTSQDEILARYLPEYRFRGDRWLLPSLVGGEALAPLMSWWLLLFALSMLARYHPAAWTQALDLDKSPLAVPLDDALEEALRAVPHLVANALLKEPIILPRR